ncbi:CBS domain-containing protein [Candidatus Woesearchaeota archaeon]|nr:CBS domain-containing protein [Candidatus Woesearchaeota archaeon]
MKFDLFKQWKLATDIPVSMIMNTKIISINEEEPVFKAVKLMAKFSIAGLIIVDEKSKPVGIISEGDIIRNVFAKEKNPKKIKLKEIMSKKLKTISPKTSIGEASKIMEEYKISKLPVIEKNIITGYITKTDLIKKTNQIYLQNRRLISVVLLNLILIMIIFILVKQIIKRGF